MKTWLRYLIGWGPLVLHMGLEQMYLSIGMILSEHRLTGHSQAMVDLWIFVIALVWAWVWLEETSPTSHKALLKKAALADAGRCPSCGSTDLHWREDKDLTWCGTCRFFPIEAPRRHRTEGTFPQLW
jgi:hypothetical protein